ncbi:aminoglycoside phosphotransferase [Saccharopolyspora mangrovi]|uniref:Aminoglycoside phosphotransferase n=1 Tax=Saccharopolyspora mangrovi TaxID=3082379 RepID=A0ABU6AIC1_9PSEU|nr:aminoglycoside phosphotransferase [Saccharopolyspora sp. S2-29]MEB3371290.1 aminoglycoside phosphotransferase [Saccharopolyspora sp. S2-29]
MSPSAAEVAEADRRFTEWMRANLTRAAAHFAVEIEGEPAFGWRLRSIGAPARNADGAPRWLRVVSEFPEWASGEFWTGNAEANMLPASIPRPRVLGTTEWADGRHQRAELATRLPGRPCSTDDAPVQPLRLDPAWWAALRYTLATLAATPTRRTHADQERVTRRIRGAFGDQLDTHVERWETVHSDLHWNNLMQPEFGLLDWEGWGRGPAGIDAATLLCCSLLNPDTYRDVRSAFADILDSPTGRVAQLYATARLLHRVEMDQRHDFADALWAHARALLNRPA